MLFFFGALAIVVNLPTSLAWSARYVCNNSLEIPTGTRLVQKGRDYPDCEAIGPFWYKVTGLDGDSNVPGTFNWYATQYNCVQNVSGTSTHLIVGNCTQVAPPGESLFVAAMNESCMPVGCDPCPGLSEDECLANPNCQYFVGIPLCASACMTISADDNCDFYDFCEVPNIWAPPQRVCSHGGGSGWVILLLGVIGGTLCCVALCLAVVVAVFMFIIKPKRGERLAQPFASPATAPTGAAAEGYGGVA